VPRLNIPESRRAGLSAILSIDRKTFDELVSTLEGISPTVGTPLRLSGLSVKGIEPQTLDKVLSAISSLFAVWSTTAELSLAEFVSDVVEAIATFDPLGKSGEAKDRLQRILDIEPLASSSKAHAIIIDHEHIFYEAKILTDLRYAFRSDPEAEPYGSVIVHMLKLTFHEAGDHKAFFVALDGDDVRRLKTVLDRAQAKARVLKKRLLAEGVHYLGKGDE
jgi:hypothetical protein